MIARHKSSFDFKSPEFTSLSQLHCSTYFARSFFVDVCSARSLRCRRDFRCCLSRRDLHGRRPLAAAESYRGRRDNRRPRLAIHRLDTSECCATSHLFLEKTIARLPPKFGDVYSATIIASDKTTVRCEKQSPEGTLSVALVFSFRNRLYFVGRQVFAMFNRRFD